MNAYSLSSPLRNIRSSSSFFSDLKQVKMGGGGERSKPLSLKKSIISRFSVYLGCHSLNQRESLPWRPSEADRRTLIVWLMFISFIHMRFSFHSEDCSLAPFSQQDAECDEPIARCFRLALLATCTKIREKIKCSCFSVVNLLSYLWTTKWELHGTEPFFGN